MKMAKMAMGAAVTIVAGLGLISPAAATPVYGVTEYLNATFDDGTSLTGQFELNVYGQIDNTTGWIMTTLDGHSEDGTSITAVTLQSTSGHVSVGGDPDTYKVDFFNGDYSSSLYLTFAQSLLLTGASDLVIDTPANTFTATPLSGQCAGFSCAAGNERLISSGSVTTSVPEPATLGLLGLGLAGLGFMKRRKEKLVA